MKSQNSSFRRFPMICLGLVPGLVLPLLAGLLSVRLIRAMMFTVPICIAAIWIVYGRLYALARKAGDSESDAGDAAHHVLAPLYFSAACPAGILFNAPGLGLFILFAVACASLYRFAALCVRRTHEGTGLRTETALIVLAFTAGLVLLFQVNLSHDAFQYYGYLVSTCMDGDLNMFDEAYIHNVYRSYNPFPEDSARYIGTAVMQAPAFFAGHVAALVLNAMGQNHALNGYSTPYFFCVNLSSALFGLAGIVLCYLIVRRFFSARISMVALFAIWWCSPLLFFNYIWNSWAHTFSFFLTSLFIHTWLATRKERSTGDWLMLGVIAGGLAMTRPSDLVVGILPLAEFVSDLQNRKPNALRYWITGSTLTSVIAIIVFSPQLAVWKITTGNWIAAPYKEVGDYFSWASPNLGGLLFSLEHHGLFAWSPALLVAIGGTLLLWKKDRTLAFGAIMMFVVTTYYYSCWSIWWSGAGFSNRFFISLTPVFVLGAAAVLERLTKRVRLEWIWIGASIVILWNVMLAAEYATDLIPIGIPDPGRAGGDPLTFSRIFDLHMNVFPREIITPVMGKWLNMGFFTGHFVGALRAGNNAELIGTLFVIVLSVGTAVMVCASVLRRRPRWVLPAAVMLVIAIHAMLWRTADATRPMPSYHRFDETRIHVRSGMEDVYLYCDYPRPVSRVDVVASLAYAHSVKDGSEVCEITAYDEDGGEYMYTLRAGIDIADGSVIRPETLGIMRHDIGTAAVARSFPIRAYSDHVYDVLLFHSELELPRPVVIRKLRFRYVHEQGRLFLSDLFLRES